ncbi:MAG: non-ribosomal peptide synthetase, partial [Moorea sp. SIO4A1]|nr:non-ribosomal peptide synthetase [Moorena sp. SIO4A1]
MLTAALSQQIAERKAEILAYLKQVRQEEHQNLPAISVIPRDENLPLSFAQERLWFINQLEGSTVAYNSPGVLRISGNLNLNALEQALSDIVRRHEVLRTSFQTVNGTPIQVIDPKATLNLKIVDLQEIEVKERETVLQQQIQQEITKPFNLERAPLIRCRLWQLYGTEYVFSITMHHIISDAWSIGIFIQELSTLYRAFTQGEPSPLAKLPIQY